jgi:hypothetical protein
MKNALRLTRAVICVIAISLVGHDALADGRVTAANPNPIETWKIIDLRFAQLATENPSAVVAVGYFRTDGSQDHVIEHAFTGAEYRSFLAAIPTPSGADEAQLTTPTGAADLPAIFRLRISRWMIAHGKIEGVTAEALNETE